MKKNIIIFSSISYNTYFYSKNKNMIALVHPLVNSIFINNIPYNRFTFEEISYYQEKFTYITNHFNYHSKSGKREKKYFNPKEIYYSIVNLSQISIELTENCNMKCKYCAYSELYEKQENRNKRAINFSSIEKLINGLLSNWESRKDKPITISFYGGEPLLNFEVLKQTVNYTKEITNTRQLTFNYQITTNGLLLLKYLDFLMEHNFKILVSLDGNDSQNKYRVTNHNLPTFKIIFNVLKKIKKNHPFFFESNIQIASVLHNENDIVEVQSFFMEEFNKFPLINALNNNGINPRKKLVFQKMYKPLTGFLTVHKEDKKTQIQIPNQRLLKIFFEEIISHTPNRIKDLFGSAKKISMLPFRGTCVPFSIKLFLTTTGHIYPCESICRQFPLGEINQELSISYDNIARIYFDLMEKYQSSKCTKCFFENYCPHCIFSINEKNISKCYHDMQKFKKTLSLILSYLEIESIDCKNFMTKKPMFI